LREKSLASTPDSTRWQKRTTLSSQVIDLESTSSSSATNKPTTIRGDRRSVVYRDRERCDPDATERCCLQRRDRPCCVHNP
jgi:hypothetical protein